MARSDRVVEPSGMSVEVLKALGQGGIQWLLKFFNKLVSGDSIRIEWRKCFLMPIFKGKGNRLKCKNCIGIKFVSQMLKLYKRTYCIGVLGSLAINRLTTRHINTQKVPSCNKLVIVYSSWQNHSSQETAAAQPFIVRQSFPNQFSREAEKPVAEVNLTQALN